MELIATVLVVAFIVLGFGFKAVLQRARTGDAGFRGLTGRPGSVEWWGGLLFGVALLMAIAGPLLALADVVERWPWPTWTGWIGLVLAVLGFLGVLLAQSGMGESWRVGVDEREETELVTGGLFSFVRNPIFSAMLVAVAGLALMVPTWVTIVAFVSLLLAVELQVRYVEEPYLLRTHGDVYARYAATTGRFVPGLGRLRPPAR